MSFILLNLSSYVLYSLHLEVFCLYDCFFFFKQKTAYEMRISDWSSDVCSSDLVMDTSLKPVLENGLYVPILAVVAPETPQVSAAAGADRASPQAHIGTSKMLERGVSFILPPKLAPNRRY